MRSPQSRAVSVPIKLIVKMCGEGEGVPPADAGAEGVSVTLRVGEGGGTVAGTTD